MTFYTMRVGAWDGKFDLDRVAALLAAGGWGRYEETTISFCQAAPDPGDSSPREWLGSVEPGMQGEVSV